LPLPPQMLVALLERRDSIGIEDAVITLRAQAPRLRPQVVARLVDDVVGAVAQRDRHLVAGADDGDDLAAAHLEQLNQTAAHAAPAAECTSPLCPRRGCASPYSANHAVRNTAGMAAACAKDKPAGLRNTYGLPTTTWLL